MAPGPALVDQAGLFEQFQVSGNGRPADRKLGRDIPGIPGRHPEHIEDLAPDGISEGGELRLKRFAHLTY
jgi:hypothetical protein